MKEKELIEKWEQTGLLDTVLQEMKFLYSTNLEKACRFLKVRNGNDQVETMIFPVVFRMTKLDKSFDIIKVVEDFIEFYKNNKFDVYRNYIVDYENDENDCELEIIESFIKNYTNENIN